MVMMIVNAGITMDIGEGRIQTAVRKVRLIPVISSIDRLNMSLANLNKTVEDTI
mgnify:CR=1 FL=1